ncbi:DoxX family membrane protein [Haliscomenobacter hydrossis]|uniref:DoxX family protein n=1 Tax=Haliscomenobacter hydrossis (strain ATCC 27775 / DSM 1100 / LMG 10767 / O) TaxID=760192 RepID=F4L181_HALH1|nr:DoxX family membrane protein [Haliscomenobacter hydrossis]AEE52813.1 hypothetical protein Halhy_4985 [Haliscomenobacter hydrossis DSM 1100]
MEQLISTLKQYRILQIFTISLRYLLGASFVYASVFKIQGKRFVPEPGASTASGSLAHFFEAMYQAEMYWHFIGWGQLIAGFLLMSQVFSTLGAVAFFSIVLNIFIITLSFESASIQIITFLMLLGNIYLLLWDWNKLKFIALPKPQHYLDNNAEFSTRRVWTYVGLLYFFIVVLLRYAMSGNPLPDKSMPVNFVLLSAVGMLLIWVITVVTQLAKK